MDIPQFTHPYLAEWRLGSWDMQYQWPAAWYLERPAYEWRGSENEEGESSGLSHKWGTGHIGTGHIGAGNGYWRASKCFSSYMWWDKIKREFRLKCIWKIDQWFNANKKSCRGGKVRYISLQLISLIYPKHLIQKQRWIPSDSKGATNATYIV